MSFCIFIASSTATTSPSLTGSPGPTGILTMSPCIGAMTVPSPLLARPAAAGAADRDRFLVSQDQAAQLGIGRHRGASVETLQIVLELLRHGRVPRTADDVVDGLRRDHLPDRRHQRRVTQLEPDAADLLKDLA